jgi:hypothetical protein
MLPDGPPAPARGRRGLIAGLTVGGAALTGVALVIATLSGSSGETAAQPGMPEREALAPAPDEPGGSARGGEPRAVGSPTKGASSRGTVAVAVSAQGARVSIGGVVAPVVNGLAVSTEVPADAEVEVLVSAPGYREYHTTLRVGGGARAELRPDLERARRGSGGGNKRVRGGAGPARPAGSTDRDGLVRPW